MLKDSKLYTFGSLFSNGQTKTSAGEILQISELTLAAVKDNKSVD